MSDKLKLCSNECLCYYSPAQWPTMVSNLFQYWYVKKNKAVQNRMHSYCTETARHCQPVGHNIQPFISGLTDARCVNKSAQLMMRMRTYASMHINRMWLSLKCQSYLHVSVQDSAFVSNNRSWLRQYSRSDWNQGLRWSKHATIGLSYCSRKISS